jgi:hypothetical protein
MRWPRASPSRPHARACRDQADDPGELGHSLDEELELQRDAMRELGYSDDYREGVAALHGETHAQFHRPVRPVVIARSVATRQSRPHWIASLRSQ